MVSLGLIFGTSFRVSSKVASDARIQCPVGIIFYPSLSCSNQPVSSTSTSGSISSLPGLQSLISSKASTTRFVPCRTRYDAETRLSHTESLHRCAAEPDRFALSKLVDLHDSHFLKELEVIFQTQHFSEIVANRRREPNIRDRFRPSSEI